MSSPSGQTMVAASASTLTRAKKSGSRRGAKTPSLVPKSPRPPLCPVPIGLNFGSVLGGPGLDEPQSAWLQHAGEHDSSNRILVIGP